MQQNAVGVRYTHKHKHNIHPAPELDSGSRCAFERDKRFKGIAAGFKTTLKGK